MSLVEAARRLAAQSPDGDDGRGDTACVYCYADHYIKHGATWARADDVQHTADCPWLQVPAIVRALEAAERLVADTRLVYWSADVPGNLPRPTCFVCDHSKWGEMTHEPGCLAAALVDALSGTAPPRPDDQTAGA